jgi:transcriptional regulator with XRE-family HTH domain
MLAVSLADAEEHAPSTGRDGPAPAEGSWDKKRAERKAEADRKAAERRKAVLDRIPAGGITRARLTAKLVQALGSSWQAGVGAVLQELFVDSEAHEIEGAVFRGPAPVQVPAAPSTPASSATASVEARARVMALARTQSWWFRRQLLSNCTTSPIWDVARAITELLAEGELEELDGSRIRVRPVPATSTVGTPAPSTSVGASSPVGGDTSSSLDSGATAEREPSADAALVPEPSSARESGASEPRAEETPARRPVPREDPDGVNAGALPAAEDQAGSADLVVTGGAAPSDPVARIRALPRPASLAGPDLRAWRTRHEISMRDLASALQLPGRTSDSVASSISAYERRAGYGHKPTLEALEALFGSDPVAGAPEPAQPSPPAPAVESSIEEPASTSVAESEPAVVSPADPDQEARGRTVAAGAAPTAGAPDAPSEQQVPDAQRPGVTTRYGDPLEAGGPLGEHAAEPAQTSPVERETVSTAADSSPPPVHGASSLVGEREGGDFASGPASRLPDLSNEGPGSAEDEVDEHPVPSDLLDELVDLRLRLEVAERQIAGYRAEREAPGDRLVLVPVDELADLEARAARADRAEAELVEARRFGAATERLLDRAESLHVRRDDDRWIRLGALGNVIDRLVVRANKEAK